MTEKATYNPIQTADIQLGYDLIGLKSTAPTVYNDYAVLSAGDLHIGNEIQALLSNQNFRQNAKIQLKTAYLPSIEILVNQQHEVLIRKPGETEYKQVEYDQTLSPQVKQIALKTQRAYERALRPSVQSPPTSHHCCGSHPYTLVERVVPIADQSMQLLGMQRQVDSLQVQLENQKLQGTIQSLQGQIQELQNALAVVKQVDKQNQSFTAEFMHLANLLGVKTIDQIIPKIEELQKRLKKLETTTQDLERARNALDAAQTKLHKNLEALKPQLAQYEKENSEQKSEISRLKKELEEITKALPKVGNEQNTLERIKGFTQSYESLVGENPKLQKQIQEQATSIQQFKEALEQLKQQQQKVKQTNNQLNANLESANKNLQENKQQIAQLQKDLTSAQSSIKVKTSEIEDLSGKLQKAKEEKSNLENKQKESAQTNKQLTTNFKAKNNELEQQKQLNKIQEEENRQITEALEGKLSILQNDYESIKATYATLTEHNEKIKEIFKEDVGENTDFLDGVKEFKERQVSQINAQQVQLAIVTEEAKKTDEQFLNMITNQEESLVTDFESWSKILDDMTESFNTEREQLVTQINKLIEERELFKNQNKDLEGQLENTSEDLKNELTTLKKQQTELNEANLKLGELVEENMGLMKKTIEEKELFKNAYLDHKHANEDLEFQFENIAQEVKQERDKFQKKLDEKKEAYQNMFVRNIALENTSEDLEIAKQNLNESEGGLILLQSELDTLKEQQAELKETNAKFSELFDKSIALLEQSNIETASLREEKDLLTLLASEQKNQLAELQTQINNLNESLKNTQASGEKADQLAKEVEALKTNLKDQQQQLGKTQSEMNQLQSAQKELKELNEKLQKNQQFGEKAEGLEKQLNELKKTLKIKGNRSSIGAILGDFKKAYDKLTSEYQQLFDENKGLKNKNAFLENANAKKDERIDLLTRQLSGDAVNLVQENQDLKGRVSHLQGQLKNQTQLEQSNKELTMQLSAHKKGFIKPKESGDDSSEKIARLSLRVDGLNKELQVAKKESEELKNTQIQALGKEVSSLKEKTKELDTIRNQSHSLEEQFKNLQNEKNEISSKNNNLEKQIQVLKKELASLKEEKEELVGVRNQSQSLEVQLKSLQSEKNAIIDKDRNLEEQIQTLQKKIDEEKAEKEKAELEASQRQIEGFDVANAMFGL